jgi:hypothetical protein
MDIETSGIIYRILSPGNNICSWNAKSDEDETHY